MRFQSCPNVDVVPASVAYADSQTKTVRRYNIPDMHRGVWLRTKPRTHAKRISSRASSEGPVFRQVIKMVKEWNRRQPVKLQGYHIEVIALKVLSSYDTYSWGVYQWFETAKDRIWTCSDGGQDKITDYLRTGQFSAVLAQVAEAEQLALEAWHLTYDGRGQHKEAIALWRRLFGHKFPAYG
jgi:hypothetical protein